MKALVVDDNAVGQDAMVELLRLSGCEAEGAANGLAALNRLAVHLVDVIVLDLCMPALDGFGFLRAKAQKPEIASIPVVVLTAAAGNALQSVQEAFPGVRALQKPVPTETLLRAIFDAANLIAS